GLAVPQAVVAVCAKAGEQDVFEQLDLGPGAGNGQRDDARCLDLVHVGEPAGQVSGGLGRVQAGLLQHLNIGPHHVGAVDVGGDRVDLAVNGEAVDQVLGELRGEVVVLVEAAQVFDLVCIDVVLELGTGMGLEGIRRVARLQLCGQDALGLGTGTAGDGEVVKRQVRVVLVEDAHEGVQACLFRTVGPPGENADLSGGILRVGGVTGSAVAASATASQGQTQHCNTGKQR